MKIERKERKERKLTHTHIYVYTQPAQQPRNQIS